jgi:hypothetical protein
MKTHVGGGAVYIYVFLTSALAGGEWLALHSGRITARERDPINHWIGDWVGPRTGLDDVEKRKLLTVPGLEFRPIYRLTHSQSLYRVRYANSFKVFHLKILNLFWKFAHDVETVLLNT